MNSKTLFRLLALATFVAATFLTISIERSPANAGDWNVNLTFEPLNTTLFVVAAVLVWVSARHRRERSEKSEEGRTK